jgi:anti-sigma regulatory factor (Ser/Thr protein kinase)
MLKENIPSTSSRFFIKEPIDLKIAITRTLSWQPLIGASAVDKSLIATLVSELASNIIKYATAGTIELRSYEWPGAVEIEVFAMDNGPGIANLNLAMQEHFSSSGTLGLGLSGIKRIADIFQMHSTVNHGTHVLAIKKINIDIKQQIFSLTTAYHSSTSDRLVAFRNTECIEPTPTIKFDIGKHIRAYPGQNVCGDQILALPLEDGYLLAIIDATGHGPEAHKMALKIIAAIKILATPDLSGMMSKLYELAKGTIGASVGLAFFNIHKHTIHYAAIGNTSLVVFNDRKWRGVSRDGMLGQRLPSFSEQYTTFNPGDMAIMFTDGLSESLISNEAHKLHYQDANTIAYRLVDTLGKPYDDSSCLVLKWNK